MSSRALTVAACHRAILSSKESVRETRDGSPKRREPTTLNAAYGMLAMPSGTFWVAGCAMVSRWP